MRQFPLGLLPGWEREILERVRDSKEVSKTTRVCQIFRELFPPPHPCLVSRISLEKLQGVVNSSCQSVEQITILGEPVKFWKVSTPVPSQSRSVAQLLAQRLMTEMWRGGAISHGSHNKSDSERSGTYVHVYHTWGYGWHQDLLKIS